MNAGAQDAIAVVTGAESGIGRAIAIELGAAGSAVVVAYKDDRIEAERTVESVQRAGGRAAAAQTDVTDGPSVDRLFAQCREYFGVACVLVNNAGINGSDTQAADMSIEQWQRTLATDLTGPFLCSRAFIRDLRGRETPGRIINISSVHQRIAFAGWADYDAAKAGLAGLMRTLALEA